MTNLNGSVNFDETEFQELFELYWNADENSKGRSFVIEELNKYIYFYATNRYQIEFDTASDFFVDNIANTKKWLEEYEPSYYISFLVYFTSKIKRKLFNYKMKAQKVKRYENLHEFYDLNPDAFIDSVFEERKAYLETGDGEKKPDLQSFTNNCLRSLNTDEQIAIKLYFGFSLTYADFRYFTKKCRLKNVFGNYRKYRDTLNARLKTEQTKREMIFKKLYLTSINIRDNSSQKILDKRQRLLSYFEDVKNLVPLRLIADIFETNITNVHRKVQRGKRKLKQLLGNQMYLNFENVKNAGLSERENNHHKRAA